jgi:diguanylate cyclase (GGDEF)-like protein
VRAHAAARGRLGAENPGVSSPPPRCRRSLARWLAATLAGTALAAWAPPSALAATVRPDRFATLDLVASDNPKNAITAARREAELALDAPTRFWALLALARAQSQLELEAEPMQVLAEAERVLAAWPQAGEAHRLWLARSRLMVTWRAETPQQSQARLGELRVRLRAVDDPFLACEVQDAETGLLLDVGSLDEAWLSAEAWERCARELGLPEREASALSSLGSIAGKGQGRSQAEPDEHFARAIAVLGDRPARQLRSVLLHERGVAQREVDRLDVAADHFRAAVALAREIDDEAGIAAGNTELAGVHLRRGEPAKALPLLQESRRLLEGRDGGFRMLTIAAYTVDALAQLRRPEVAGAMALVRRYDTASVPAAHRARVARTLAAGHASLGRWAEAYAETQRAEKLLDEGRRAAADVQNLRLQARYAAARRETENAELRHRSEASRLALVAEEAKQRALWATVATLAVLLAGAAGWAWSAIARRRALADLALRDDLTGQPNRRAVSRYAQTQFDRALLRGTPLTLALIDLDHFKSVNDTHGHAGGDAVLRALAAAGAGVLRAQDRLGRWGGEEWMLVLPGLAVDELPAVDERLRRRFAETPAEGIAGAHGTTFSMGAAELGPDTPTLDALIAACDVQLYRAKAAGRNRLSHAGLKDDGPQHGGPRDDGPAVALDNRPVVPA